VAASTGNHGAAVAYAARLLGVRARIFLPRHPNPVKPARIAALGATIVEGGRDLAAAIDFAIEYAGREDAFFLHDASDPDIPFGTGTIGLEILEQLPSTRAVYVPVGDTALIRGVASAVKASRPATRIVGVLATSASAYYLSWHRGAVIETVSADTIADGLAVTRPLLENVSAIRTLVDEIRLVTDAEMLSAVNLLWSRQQIVAEPSGAAGVAAMMQRPQPDNATVTIISGSNIAPDIMTRAMNPNR
jgi:threonine dehydratase